MNHGAILPVRQNNKIGVKKLRMNKFEIKYVWVIFYLKSDLLCQVCVSELAAKRYIKNQLSDKREVYILKITVSN